MWNGKIEDYILFEDRDILVCHKPAGLAVQSGGIGTADMESTLKNYLAAGTPGKIPYLGIVHRLDQPVEGVIVFAKNQGAARELSRQMTGGGMGKEYFAVTALRPKPSEGTLEDYLVKNGRTNTSKVTAAGTAGAKKARLTYETLEEISDEAGKRFLLRVTLETGRHHQIRVQMAHNGTALLGDCKYNPGEKAGVPIGLCACCLKFTHPKTKKRMEFRVTPKGEAFRGFKSVLSYNT